MNKLFTLALITTLFSIRSFATNHIVTAQNFYFSPGTFTCNVGDTVTWQWVSGIEHGPTSDTIPAGAASWADTISQANPTASYIVREPGAYYYKCVFHTAEGMFANFTAVPATGIPTVEENIPVKIYPVPFQNKLTINASGNPAFKESVTIEVSNILGQQKYFLLNSTDALVEPVSLDLSMLTPGIYFVTLSEGIIRKTYRIVKSE